MASRLPRRSFATPVVLTLAALPACMVSTSPTQSQPPPHVQPHAQPHPGPRNPNTPPPRTAPADPAQPPIVIANPPRPTPPPTKPGVEGPTPLTPPRNTEPRQPPKPGGPTPLEPTPPRAQPVAAKDRHWVVARTGATCRATDTDACRGKPAPRNGGMPSCTPPQVVYKCPTGLADGATLNIIQYASQTTCTVVLPTPTCPPNARCAPPAPRPVACPS